MQDKIMNQKQVLEIQKWNQSVQKNFSFLKGQLSRNSCEVLGGGGEESHGSDGPVLNF